jgi:hypothetical protein
MADQTPRTNVVTILTNMPDTLDPRLTPHPVPHLVSDMKRVFDELVAHGHQNDVVLMNIDQQMFTPNFSVLLVSPEDGGPQVWISDVVEPR